MAVEEPAERGSPERDHALSGSGVRWLALFASDVHLQPAIPRTTEAFLQFLRTWARHSRALYLLGDLFEYWAGDDDLEDPFHRQIVRALRDLSDAGVALYWIGGNRDFLIGDRFAAAAGMARLTDPAVVNFDGNPVVLAHGDAQCTDDLAYMHFRRQVRDDAWQATFLAQPLSQRKAIIAGMREQSKAAMRGKSAEIMDVNESAIASLFADSGARLMIHGHTHRPARHLYATADGYLTRHVLPDWDCEDAPARGGWLSIDLGGTVERHALDGSVVD